MTLEKLPSLNGLRAISIILVILSHIDIIANGIFGSINHIIIIKPILAFLLDGHLGVNVFFVISGFLITSLLIQEQAQKGAISLKKFYIRRTLRIFPAYFFLMFVYFILQLLNHIHIPNNEWLTALTYTKDLKIGNNWYTGHTWSLSVEEHFYLCFPFIFLLGKKKTALAMCFIMIFVPLFRVFAHIYTFDIDYFNEFSLLFRMDSIATGCLFGLYRNNILSFLQKKWNIYTILALLALLTWRYAPGAAQIIHNNYLMMTTTALKDTIPNISVAVIMMYAVFHKNTLFFKFLNTKAMNFIGLLSYSIYLWQQLFLHNTQHWYNQLPINILLIIIFALFSYYIIEKPFLRLKSKFNA